MAEADDLGTRLKGYEALDTARKAFKGQPLIARLDGKSFHTFCRGLEKPFDDRLTQLMRETMAHLVERFGASAGYTQSDEITLAWFVDSTSRSEYVFDGRFQKLDSLLAATATAFFNSRLSSCLPTKATELPIFDCRSFVVPNLLEAYHCFLWRQQDCRKNAISMVAQSMFSHKSLQGMNGLQMIQRIKNEKGIDFESYSARHRLGTFVRRVKSLQPLSSETIEKLSRIGRPFDPAAKVERSSLEMLSMELRTLEDPIGYLFKGSPAIIKNISVESV